MYIHINITFWQLLLILYAAYAFYATRKWWRKEGKQEFTRQEAVGGVLLYFLLIPIFDWLLFCMRVGIGIAQAGITLIVNIFEKIKPRK